MTRTIGGTSKEKKSPDYLFRIIPQGTSSYITRNSDEIPLFKAKHNFYRNSSFPSTTIISP